MPQIHELAEPDDFMDSLHHEFYDMVSSLAWVKEQLIRIAQERDIIAPDEEIDDLAEWLHGGIIDSILDYGDESASTYVCDDCADFSKVEENVVAKGVYGEGYKEAKGYP